MKAACSSLLALVFLGSFEMAPAREILVKNGRDVDGLEPPPESLRAAVQNAQPGDTIRFASPLTVLLETDLNVATAGLRFEGPGQIRARPFREGPDGTTQEGEEFNVFADAVTLNNLTFRNVGVTFGGTASSVYLQGATITNCRFAQDGALELAQVENGLVEKNRFEHSYTLNVSSIFLHSTRACVVFDNVIENNGDPRRSEGILSLRDEALRIEKVVSNRGFFVQPLSATIVNNQLKTSSLVVDTSLFNGTNMLVENNEAKRLFTKGLNMTLRRFASEGPNLVPGDTNQAEDIFARDISRDFDD